MIDNVAQLTAPLPLPPLAKMTRSEAIFALGTGADPRSLTMARGNEFYLFMRLRLAHQWKSHNMSGKKFVDATALYNCELEALAKKNFVPFYPKHPRALSDKLGEVEATVTNRMARQNFFCARLPYVIVVTTLTSRYSNTAQNGTDVFWKEHCFGVPLVKAEPAANGNTVPGKEVCYWQ